MSSSSFPSLSVYNILVFSLSIAIVPPDQSALPWVSSFPINKVYVNEINTIPGALSYYLWEASGKTFEQELEEMINIAIKRHRERQNLTFSYDQNILALTGGTKGCK